MSTTEIAKKKRKREFPHTLIILAILGLFAMVTTWFIPAGVFERVTSDAGITTVVPGSFHFIDSNPQSILDYGLGIFEASVISAEACFFIYMNVAAFAIINDTGALNAGLTKLAHRMRGKEKLMIPVVMFAFSMLSAVIGLAEEGYPFIPIMMSVALSMGFDSFTGVLIVILASSAGFTGGMLCPFTVGLAQSISELPPLSGMGFRAIVHAVYLTIMIVAVWRYASKIKKNPELSLSYEPDLERRAALLAAGGEEKPLTFRQKLTIVIFVVGMIIFAYGVVKLLWGFAQMALCFMTMGILCGIASGMRPNDICRSACKGLEDIAYIGLLLGFSRVIMLMMEKGQILDTILFYAAEALDKLPTGLSAIGMYVLQCFISFFVAGSGAHALITMPLMVPLADAVGITRQTAVLAWQLGDSISNVWLPTSYSVIAMSMARVPWEKYFKWYIPCMIVQYIVGAIFVLVAVAINFGPY